MTEVTVPTYDGMMPHLMQALHALGGSGTVQEIDQKTIELLDLPEEVLDVPQGDTGQLKVENRLGWSRSYLKKVGLIDNPTRGVWELTSEGQSTTQIDPTAIVEQVREMVRLASAQKKDDLPEDATQPEDADPPEEMLDDLGWREQLRNVLLNIEPDRFERLTQRILRESGFVQVQVTGKTGDGGIDGTGTIKLHGMISFHMVFQCKRYQGSVSAPEIRNFRGAVEGRANKGLLITTGTFTRDAREEASRPGAIPIDLMDGEALMDCLQELELGVRPRRDYEIDEKFFLSI